MKKDHKTLITEYLRTLNEEDLVFLSSRLSDKFGGDVPDALNFMSVSPSMDSMFKSAHGAMELFDLCDKVKELVVKERLKGRAA